METDTNQQNMAQREGRTSHEERRRIISWAYLGYAVVGLVFFGITLLIDKVFWQTGIELPGAVVSLVLFVLDTSPLFLIAGFILLKKRFVPRKVVLAALVLNILLAVANVWIWVDVLWFTPPHIIKLQTGTAHAAVTSDLANLKSEDNKPFAARAYDLVQVEGAWDEIDKAITGGGLPAGVPARATVGIIDTGLDASHPEFAGTVLGNTRFGVVDLGETPVAARTDTNPDGHGTQVAGIIGAGNIAPFVPLSPDSPQMNGVLSGIPSIPYALEMRSRTTSIVGTAADLHNLGRLDTGVVNVSLGFTRKSALTLLQVTEFQDEGAILDSNQFIRVSIVWNILLDIYSEILFVPAVNNYGVDAEDATPANHGDKPNVLTVGGVNTLATLAAPEDEAIRWVRDVLESSGFGADVGIAAPASDVYAPKPGNEYTEIFGGTSAAAPFVTGVAGLIASMNPNLTSAELKTVLVESASPIATGESDKLLGSGCYDPNSNPNDFTGCLLNAHRAVCHPLTGLNCTTKATIEKTLINNDGGTATVSDFEFLLDGDPVDQGVEHEVSSGTHTLEELPLAGYTASAWGGDCASDGTLTVSAVDPEFADGYTCTIVNDDVSAPALRQLTSTTFGNSLSPAISGDGMHVAFISFANHAGENPGNDLELYTVAADGTNLTKETTNTRPQQFGRGEAIDIDQDGSTIALLSASDPLGTNADGNVELFVLDNGTLTQLTSTISPVRNESVSIANDGSTIAFVSTGNYTGQNGDAGREVFTVSSDGTTFRQLTNNTGRIEDARISGDGSAVLFATFSVVLGNRSLHVVDTGSSPTVSLVAADVTLGNNPAFFLNISDDGSTIAFAGEWDPVGSNPTNNYRIFTMKTDGTNIHQVSSGRSLRSALSGDGATVAFTEGGGIEAANVDGTNKRTVFSNLGAVSPTSLDIVGMTLVFGSQADPLGTNPENNTEIFLQTL